MKKQESLALLLAVTVIATCGLIYELVAGALASYLLGDTITQFSTIIGMYLFAMGVGSFLSKYINHQLLEKFILIEYLVGIIGGLSAALLFYLFNEAIGFIYIIYLFVFVTGVLVGLEIPLLMNILKNNIDFKSLVSRVFTFDYLGALLASIVFPLFFIPKLGLIKTSLFFGILNITTGIVICYMFEKKLHKQPLLKFYGFISLGVLIFAFIMSDKILSATEQKAFPGKIIYAKSSPYQRIIITRTKNDIRLFLNSNLQFSTIDEHRYHEALVHPAMTKAKEIKNVLILGGGDGLAAREILKYEAVQKIDLIDLDPAMTKLFTIHPLLTNINNKAFSNKKITVYNGDAFTWVKNCKNLYDVVIIDFPDPSNYSLGKLYTNTFYSYLKKIVNPQGVAVIQSTSPFVAKKSYWCVQQTLQSVGFNTTPYNNTVPSFGIWGYIMATMQTALVNNRALPKDLKFYTDSSMKQMQYFTDDLLPNQSVEINKLNNQTLVHYFEKEWSNYLQN